MVFPFLQKYPAMTMAWMYCLLSGWFNCHSSLLEWTRASRLLFPGDFNADAKGLYPFLSDFGFTFAIDVLRSAILNPPVFTYVANFTSEIMSYENHVMIRHIFPKWKLSSHLTESIHRQEIVYLNTALVKILVKVGILLHMGKKQELNNRLNAGNALLHHLLND